MKPTRLPFLETFASDLRHSWRNLLKNKRWTVVAILSLAAGIGTNVGLFRTAAPLIQKLPVHNPDELVAFRFGRGRTTVMESNQVQVSYFVFEQLQAANRTLTDVFAFSESATCSPEMAGSECPGNGTLIVKGRGENAEFQYVSGNYFTALGISAVRGRTIVASDDTLSAAPVAVISYNYWQDRFAGDPAIVGSSVVLNNEPATIVGVLPKGSRDLVQPQGGISDILLPLAVPRRALNRRTQADLVRDAFNVGVPEMGWLVVMGRRKPGIRLAQVQDNLGGVGARAAREEWETFSTRLSPKEREQLPKSRLKGFLTRKFPPIRVVTANHGPFDMHPAITYNVAFLFTISGIFLFIVCMNITNFLLARAAARQTEIGVRAALGASRGRLISQLLTESCLLAVLAGVVSLWVARWPELVFPMGPDGKPSPITAATPAMTDWLMLIVSLALSLLVGLVSGIGPAWSALRTARAPALRKAVPFGGSRSFLTRSMLIAQVALSLALLIVAGLFMKSVHNTANASLGFNLNNVVVFTIEPKANGYDPIRAQGLHTEMLNRLSKVPGVRSASFSDSVPLGIGSNPVSIPKPRDGSGDASTGRLTVHPNFFRTLEIPLRLGRTFTNEEGKSAPRVAVVNMAFARKFFSNENPLGQVVRFGERNAERDIEIVGVVGDTKSARSVDKAASPMLYTTSLQEDLGRVTFEIQTMGNPGEAIPAIRETVQAADPSLPILGLLTYKFVYEWFSIGDQRLMGELTRVIGGFALLFAMIGLFSLMSYAVTRRTREIGIRMSIGAQRQDVLLSVLREGLSIVAVGTIVGVAFALALSPLLESELTGLTPHDPGTILLMIALTFAVGAAAGYLPARRASHVDPMIALRDE